MDIPEAKTEILEGLIAEYSGRNLALLKMTLPSGRSPCVVSWCPFSSVVAGRFLGMSSVVAFAVDFLWFWIKVFLVQMVSVTLVRTSLVRLKIWQASKFYWFRFPASRWRHAFRLSGRSGVRRKSDHVESHDASVFFDN
jgi:formate hydrogenlyase subunit 4